MSALNIAANQIYARPFQAAREAAAATRRNHPMLSEQALKDFYLTATVEEIKALERIEAKHE